MPHTARFCTAVNCMDGRVQDPVNAFLKTRFAAVYVDAVTEPGPNGILAAGDPEALVASIFSRVAISVQRHGSIGIAVVGHYDCAGNPGDRQTENEHTSLAVDRLKARFPGVPVIGLYVDEHWTVTEIV